ncbi:MAG: ATP-binding protein [Desulfobacula sp.]|uniref:ATP-binding protein n=1 Tax=Desulfobacula sp. TaxID=2593537 RepID=UPI0025C6F3BD|nr:ATP-binding protein [Desulfobacula sp.]MCD4718709.1 ATP-binding protein [Desulfobacula sp.]
MSFKKLIFDVLQTAGSISFTFSSTMGNIDDVCERTTNYIQSKIKGIEAHLFSINLVIREGLTNAVRHGNKSDPEKIVRFLLTITENESIHLMIEDQGGGFDWRKLQNLDLPENNDHGRGIMIMKAYFSHYSYNDKGNILYLEKDIFSKI